jgi:hypothetical protein
MSEPAETSGILFVPTSTAEKMKSTLGLDSDEALIAYWVRSYGVTEMPEIRIIPDGYVGAAMRGRRIR